MWKVENIWQAPNMPMHIYIHDVGTIILHKYCSVTVPIGINIESVSH